MPLKSRTITYFRVGDRRFPFAIHEQMENGDEYLAFPLHGAGLHISFHRGANPHLKDRNATYSRLDLQGLRTTDWESESKGFGKVLESRFYWPEHRADLFAIPGPHGTTLIEALTQQVRDNEFDLVEYFRLLFGSGVWFKVGYRDHRAFFRSKIGKRSLIMDPREECGAIFMPLYPGKPLLRIREGEPFPMPAGLQHWKDSLDYHITASWESTPSHHVAELLSELEKELQKLSPMIQRLKLVRWRPRRRKRGHVRSRSS